MASNERKPGDLGEYEIRVVRSVFIAFRDTGGAGIDALELWDLATPDERRAIATRIRERFDRIASLAGHAAALLGNGSDEPVKP
jgi:hypothetical protein